MEEELQKRNTDCVYFLASPLTCRKGGECEYRHSEVARLNPRDCRYWLSGNCRNSSCGFRHPPLEKQTDSALESDSSQQQASMSAAKPNVPCYFYFNGFCSKGDKCSFSHVPETQSLKYIKPNSASSPRSTAPPKKALHPTLKPANHSLPIRNPDHHDHDERSELSPGFDVLVDDKSEYVSYENDDYQQSSDQEANESFQEDESSTGKRKSRPANVVQDDLRHRLTKRRNPGISQRLRDRLIRGDFQNLANGHRGDSTADDVFNGPKSLAQILDEKKKNEFDGPKALSEILKDKRKVSPL